MIETLKLIKEWTPVAVLIGAIIYGFFKNIFKKKHPNISSDIKFSIPIYNILNDIIIDLKATRAFIKQFHNGNEFYSGQKMQRLTISHERCAPRVAPLRPYHDGILVPAEVHDIFNEMDTNHKEWFWCSDVSTIITTLPELFQWMKSHDVVSVLYFRLRDKKTGDPIGLLGITFNYRFRLDEISDILELTKKKKEIEREFSNV